MIPIKTIYNKSNDNNLTIHQKIENISKYIKQCSSRDSFAYIRYSIEPYNSDYPIIFENKAQIEDEFKGKQEFEEDFNLYVEAVMKGIEEAVNYIYEEHNKCVSDIKITLLELLMNPYDSNVISYKIAGCMVIKKTFSDIFIQKNN